MKPPQGQGTAAPKQRAAPRVRSGTNQRSTLTPRTYSRVITWSRSARFRTYKMVTWTSLMVSLLTKTIRSRSRLARDQACWVHASVWWSGSNKWRSGRRYTQLTSRSRSRDFRYRNKCSIPLLGSWSRTSRCKDGHRHRRTKATKDWADLMEHKWQDRTSISPRTAIGPNQDTTISRWGPNRQRVRKFTTACLRTSNFIFLGMTPTQVLILERLTRICKLRGFKSPWTLRWGQEFMVLKLRIPSRMSLSPTQSKIFATHWTNKTCSAQEPTFHPTTNRSWTPMMRLLIAISASSSWTDPRSLNRRSSKSKTSRIG